MACALLMGEACLTSCSEEEDVLQPMNPVRVAIHAVIDGGIGSRVSLTDDAANREVKVDWKAGDAFSIPVNGTPYTFTYDETEGKFFCNAENFPATFTQGGTVTATYPATAPTGHATQGGTLEAAAGLIAMNATLDVAAGQSTQGLKLVFNHQSAILKMTATNTDFAGKPVDVSFSATGLLADGNSIATAAPVTADANGSVTVYFAVPSTTTSLSNATLSVSCSEVGYSATLNSAKQLEAGKLYNINKEAVRDFEITTADDGKTTYTVNTYAGLQAWRAAVMNEDGTMKDADLNLTLGMDIILPAVAEDGSNWTPVGGYVTDVGYQYYKGIIDGAGHTISGLVINSSNQGGNGFIGMMDGGSITNLKLADVRVTGSSSTGALVGLATDTNISNCEVTGTVSGSGYMGGLIGTQSRGEIIGCINRAAVTTTDQYAGGIVGYAYGLTISECGNYGSVAASHESGYAGGMAGYAFRLTIQNCINYAASITGKLAGYLVGYAEASINFSDCKNQSGNDDLVEYGFFYDSEF